MGGAAISHAGLLTADERDQIIAGLEAMQTEIAPDPAAAFAAASDEDIHSYVERRLTERIGAAAGKLHTGRSRNDQVATDVRLWLKWQITALDAALADLIRAAVDHAEVEIDVLMPGYTHVQPAQPVRWSHWLLSRAWPWRRDRAAWPISAGAWMFRPWAPARWRDVRSAIDREALAADLGFTAASQNSLDAVSDRDFIAEFLFWAALTGVHLSQWAEDLVIWSSREYRLRDVGRRGTAPVRV